MPAETVSLVNAVVGGSMIGAAAMAMLQFTGRTLGFSGITKGLWFHANDWKWRTVFLGSLFTSSLIIKFTHPVLQEPIVNKDAVFRLLLGGFLVGIGSGMSNGCTSGHGIIGMSRLSYRSIVATLVFMSSAVASATLGKLAAVYPPVPDASPEAAKELGLVAAVLFGLLITIYSVNRQKIEKGEFTVCSVAMMVFGSLCGIGLHVSGMGKPSKIAAFLDISNGVDVKGSWDPTLLFVMVGAHLVAMPVYHLIIKPRFNQGKCSLTGAAYCLMPPTAKPDMKLFGGATLFGLGWGLCALCPGPAHIGMLAPNDGDQLLRIGGFQVMMGLGWAVQAALANGLSLEAIVNAKAC